MFSSSKEHERRDSREQDLDASSSSAARSPCPVMRNGCDIFDPTDPETRSRQHSNRGLSARTGCSGSMSTRCPYSNVKSCDASVLRRPCRCTSRLHRRIWRTLKSICLNVLPAGASGNSLCSSKVSNVHQCVVERGVDVRDTPTFNAFL